MNFTQATPSESAPSISTPSGYFEKVRRLLDELERFEGEAIGEAADLLVEQIRQDRLIHVFGVSGHSVIGSEEFFWRAGGLCHVNPLFDLSLSLQGGGLKSTRLERQAGIGDKVIDSAQIEAGDVVIITSIYGMNAATIDAALRVKDLGATLIAITSAQHALHTPPEFAARHPSRANLHDLADVTIDNHVPYGDTIVEVPGVAQKVGPVSTILVSAAIQWLVIETARRAAAAGVEIPVWQSANTVGGDHRNEQYLERFLPRVKAL